MNQNYIVCHYAEIGLKGKNRNFFEQALIKNIKRVLNPVYFSKVCRIYGRIIVELTDKAQNKQNKIKKALNYVFGLAYFAFANSANQNLNSIKEKALELLKDKKFKTFRISTQRSKKDFALNSQQINERVGEYIIKNFQFFPLRAGSRYYGTIFNFQNKKNKIKVNLKNPDINIFIEIVDKYCFLYTKKHRGPGGLPNGTSGKTAVLISGGIDSPVAAWQIMKRGARTVFVHFHALPYTNKSALEKVKKITKILAQYQDRIKLYLVPFAKIQKEILLKTCPKLRVVLYRRFMLRLAEKIAQKEKALALVTGESLGQVASQTLENIRTIDGVIRMPVLRPLIGFNKEEIISLAKKIDTYDTSILPGQDCCSRFLPKHPETHAKTNEIKLGEASLDIKKLITQALKGSEVVKL